MLTKQPQVDSKVKYDRDGEIYKVTGVDKSIMYLLSLETGQKTSAIWQFKDKLNECFSEA